MAVTNENADPGKGSATPDTTAPAQSDTAGTSGNRTECRHLLLRPGATCGACGYVEGTVKPTILERIAAIPADPDNDVRANLIMVDGNPKSCGSNIERILRDSKGLAGFLRFNELAKTVEITGGRFKGKPLNGLDVAIKNWLETSWEMFTSTQSVGEQLLHVARTWGSHNPLVDYLRGLKWDGVQRLGGGSVKSWLETYCHAETELYGKDIREDVRLMARRWMIGAVARALQPGCKMDTVLVLEGAQGFKKSTALAVLGEPWFSDTAFRIGEKDGLMAAGAAWIMELGELANVIRAGTEAQKQWLASKQDSYRPPYGRVIEQFPRCCALAGTINPAKDGSVDYLADESGERRWWPVRVGAEIDIEGLKRDRDLLWAEAVHAFDQCQKAKGDLDGDHAKWDRWWFTLKEQKELDQITNSRKTENPWVPLIQQWYRTREMLVKKPDENGVTTFNEEQMERLEFRLADVAEGALKISPAFLDKEKKKIARALREAGFRPCLDTSKRRWEEIDDDE